MRLSFFAIVGVLVACKRDPRMEMMEAPPELQRCVPAGDDYGSVVEVRYGEVGKGVATNGCISSTHDAACIKEYVASSKPGESGTMKRMLIVRTVIQRPGGPPHIGTVTFAELGQRKFKVNGACAMSPL